MPKKLIQILALVFGVLPIAAFGEHDEGECPYVGISVKAATPDQAERICEFAQEAVSLISSCHLPQQRPIRIEVVDEIAHPFAICLAGFDCDYDRIRIVVRDSYTALVEPEDPYADFPPEALVRTLLFHEITHALIEQNSADREVPLVDHEYIAAAMELEHMDPALRETILHYANLETPADGRVNIWIYRLDPRRFAANAWLHFRLPRNGCDLVERLVTGDASFDSQ
jgi:hypothetical protein